MQAIAGESCRSYGINKIIPMCISRFISIYIYIYIYIYIPHILQVVAFVVDKVNQLFCFFRAK